MTDSPRPIPNTGAGACPRSWSDHDHRGMPSDTMGKWLKAALALSLALTVAHAHAQGTINAINAQVTYGAVPDWTYVAGSSTGSGTDNTTALTNALNSCGQNGGSNIYLPPGAYYIGGAVVFGNCDTELTMAAGAKIICNLAITCLEWNPTWGNQQTLAGIIEGYTNINSNGFAPATGGSSCEVGDILTLRADANSYIRNPRERTLFQVATCSGGAVATLNVLQAGEYLANPGASTGTFQTVSGTTTGVSTTNLTWSTAPQLGGAIRTELVLSGTNATTEGGNCVTLDSDSSSICMGDKIKIISNQQAPWQYSNTLRSTAVVIGTADPSYGPVIASGGSGCTAGDVLTALTLASPVARNANGMPVQAASTTPATFTVGAVTATGAIIPPLSVTTTGTYDHISYGPIPLTGGTCGTAPSVYLSFANSAGMGFGEIAEVAQVIDATHILLNRLLYFPHVFDATNPPLIAKLPGAHLVMHDVTVQASGEIHNSAYSGRVPANLLAPAALYMCSAGGPEGSNVKITGSGVRHGVTSCANGYSYAQAATHFAEIGSTADILVHDFVITGSHASGFDTHEDGINWTFADDISSSDTPDPRNASTPSTGMSIRAYNVTMNDFRSNGNVNCVSDSSQRFPFSGIFAKPSITKVFHLDCENGDIQLGTGQASSGYVVNGDSADLSYGSHDPYATTTIKGAHFSSFNTAVLAREGGNRINIDDAYMEDVTQAVLVTGPTDFSLTNSVFDDLGTFRIPAISELTRRTLSTHYTGVNAAIFSNDLWERSSVALAGSKFPQTVFRTLETAVTNGTTVYMGNNQVINGAFTNLFSTAGAPVTLVNTNYNPQTGNAIQKVTAIAVSMAATGDQAIIAIPPQITKYRVLGVDVGHCSASLATAFAGVWSAASRGGANIAANQALSGCAGGTANFSLVLAAGASNTDLTSASLCFNVGTSQASAVADVTIWLLDKSIN